MVAHAKRETGVLSVTMHRDGEPDKSALASDGRQALQIAVRLLLEAHRLRAGDRLTIEIAN